MTQKRIGVVTEYIEREGAIKEFSNNGSIFVYGKQHCKAIVSRLNAIHAADVRPVVLCRNCIFRSNEWTGCPKLNGTITDDEFFCVAGKKREDRKE